MIRVAKEDDIEFLNQLGLLNYENFDKRFDLKSDLNNNLVIILVYDDNDIKGFLYALNLIDNIDLLYIVTDERYRRKGVAKELLNYLIKKYQKPIMLEVRVDNSAAISLYESLNFQKIYMRKKYYNNLIDAIIMRREK
ncbi:MAG: GNAT family N-acetyltransferase [Firmicutes bacterium]|nr:GNAT family N-acetyltransferase [Bacillota bacterium]